MSAMKIVVVGASWGGLAALSKLVTQLPKDFPIPIIVVQHRSRHGDNLLASLLQDMTQLKVVDVEDKEPLCGCTVFLAPANYHLLVEQEYLSLTTDPVVRFSRPSIDVTFISAADTYRAGVIGVVLTGANDDGARGLRHIVSLGGKAIVQDPATAESPSMPSAAMEAVPQAEVLPLEKIPERLVQLAPKHAAERKAG
jgi:two-component system chemotaxis response regulator CheB